jgi:hypothetical protein
MFKKSTLVRALFAVAISTCSFAASAADYTINFDGIASGSNASNDLVALANGVSFASGHLVDTVDADWNVIGQHWAAYSLADDGVDPAIFAQNSANMGWGTAPSGANALDARFDQVLVQFSNPTQLTGFSFDLDHSSYGNLQAVNVLFLDENGNTLLSTMDFYQSSTTSFSQNFSSALTVSAVLLPSGKLYDNLSVATVPEPESYAMLLAGLGLMGFTARRKASK